MCAQDPGAEELATLGSAGPSPVVLRVYSAKRRPAPRPQRSGREEAGRGPRPRRPRSQGQLHSSLQTVTSSPAHPSPAPLPPPHNCLLHLS